MSHRRIPRILLWGIVLILLLGLSAEVALARGGGVYWGYQSPTQWSPIWNYWRFASPWGALVGAGIPHHSLDPPQFNMGQPPGGGQGGGQVPFGWSWRTQPVDRSVMFPGSSSNVSGPSLPSSFAQGGGIERPIPEGVFATNRQFEPLYFHNYNSYWLQGYWGGGRWGWSRWAGKLGTRGFPRWSIGPDYYLSGYADAPNPFLAFARHLSGAEIYAQPLLAIPDDPVPGADEVGPDGTPVPYSANPELAAARAYLLRSPEVTVGLRALDASRAAFRKKQYDEALVQIDLALKSVPHDPAFHEFRALVLFAKEDYPAAAAVIYAVLTVSPGWNWTTLSNHYDEQAEFTRQLRALEAFRRGHPDSPEPAFLSAYHYVTCRHFEAAVKQLETVQRLLPSDRLVPPLSALLAGAVENSADSTVEATAAPKPTPQAAGQVAAARVDKKSLQGTWHSTPRGGVTIDLTFADDDRFTWNVTRDQGMHKFEGHFTLTGNQLWLEIGNGGMSVQLTPDGDSRFHFKIVDLDATDPGLQFSR